jgi:HK97 gp10 family phage protein
MAVRAKLSTKGFAEYLERIAEAGGSVDAAADRALEAGGAVLLAGMQARVPKDTRNLENSLVIEGPIADGNFHYILVGLDRNADANTARYGTAQEYGTPRMAAQPYVRPTMDADKGKASKAMRDSLKKDGIG